VCLGKGMRPVLTREHIVQVSGLRRRGRSAKRIDPRIRDGTDGQTPIHVGVVGAVDPQVLVEEPGPCARDYVLDGGIDLELHVLLEPIVDHRGDQGLLLAQSRLPLDHRGDDHDVVRSEPAATSVGKVDALHLLGELVEHHVDHVVSARAFRDAVRLGYKATERTISINEVIEGIESGRLTESFGTGTAAAISPVGLLSYRGKDYTINNFEIGPISQQMYDTLLGIQYGKLEDPFGWVTRIDY